MVGAARAPSQNASNSPVDFFNHQSININEILIKGKRTELHHIFPRNSKTGKKHADTIDSIVNITFLPKDTNNSLVNNKEPGQYFLLAKNYNTQYFTSDLNSHPQLGYLRSSSFTLGFKPKSLIAVIWIHFLWEALGVQKPRRCLICGTWFTGRSQAKTGGEQTLGSERRSACRTELYRRKRWRKSCFYKVKKCMRYCSS